MSKYIEYERLKILVRKITQPFPKTPLHVYCNNRNNVKTYIMMQLYTLRLDHFELYAAVLVKLEHATVRFS